MRNQILRTLLGLLISTSLLVGGNGLPVYCHSHSGGEHAHHHDHDDHHSHPAPASGYSEREIFHFHFVLFGIEFDFIPDTEVDGQLGLQITAQTSKVGAAISKSLPSFEDSSGLIPTETRAAPGFAIVPPRINDSQLPALPVCAKAAQLRSGVLLV